MESRPPSSDPPRDADPPQGPQAPAGPPAPPGLDPPAYAQPPTGPQASPGPESPAGYSAPAPPGAWQQPSAQQQDPGWIGRPLASWGSRVAATLIDYLILTVPVALIVGLVVAVVLAGSEVAGIVVGLIALLAYVLASLFYAPVLMARDGECNGQTWGKQILGIQVVRDEGRPIDIGFGFLREFVVQRLLFVVVGGLLFYIPTIVNWLWPLWDDQNRCLHDMIVKTHVVRS